MFHSNQYTSASEIDYIPVSGVVAEDVVRIQRNGIGVKFQSNFESNPVDVDVYSFEWIGVDTNITLAVDAYILTVTNSVTSYRTVVYKFGPVVGNGYVYLFTHGTQQASYTAIPLDGAEQVRDGVEAALNAVTWPFTISTVAIGTDTLMVTFSDTSDFETFIGRINYKVGYYCNITDDYLIYYDESATGYPALPGVSPSYDFADLTLMPDGVEAYLADPNTTPMYVETLAGVSSISGVPGSQSVPDQIAVIDQTNQRVYFWETLNIGELIKVFQK